ncbi:hypothetical protein M406DRAFT_101088 [Cryphonectria parasitica EP155]|uniref:Uncharacterized protein n=1 Tax=Cryphonectria parasitica (strain ATCC 38755 / EP155) TaxID=660469 RepID=A0A9P4YEJ8_CRYP1|nr:uncharacterized protein M406DRAFT_101088 [Cryphonectria parasitica EP155]KAF3771030.1 hypothetical protein M406DRAFT_101088 [Cryphonectria parasitica EP155]
MIMSQGRCDAERHTRRKWQSQRGEKRAPSLRCARTTILSRSESEQEVLIVADDDHKRRIEAQKRINAIGWCR